MRSASRQAQILARSVSKPLDLWTEAYGSEAGNIAMRALAFGGIYIAGGIAPKNSIQAAGRRVLSSFLRQDAAFSHVLARVPIYVVLNEDAPVWGAAYQALAAARAHSLSHSQRKVG